MPKDVLKPVLDRKGNEDFGSANFPQAIVTRLLKTGAFQNHVGHVRASYTRKRDAMLAAADRFFRDDPGSELASSERRAVRVDEPAGARGNGLQEPSVPDGGEESRRDVRSRRTVLCAVQGGRPKNHMRLSYGVQSPEGITDGMERLARAVKEVV